LEPFRFAFSKKAHREISRAALKEGDCRPAAKYQGMSMPWRDFLAHKAEAKIAEARLKGGYSFFEKPISKKEILSHKKPTTTDKSLFLQWFLRN